MRLTPQQLTGFIDLLVEAVLREVDDEIEQAGYAPRLDRRDVTTGAEVGFNSDASNAAA